MPKKLKRKQMVRVVKTIFDGCVDMLMCTSPLRQTLDERKMQHGEKGILDSERYAIQTTGFILTVFAANYSPEGLTGYSALDTFADFAQKCHSWIEKSWKHNAKEHQKQLARKKGQGCHVSELLPGFPDTGKHAKAFITALFQETT